MEKSNWIYVAYRSFTSDLLFWIVIDNLFLTTVKGFSAFEIVLISMLGIAGSLLLYPITNLIVKKTRNKTSIIIGALCYCVAIIMFMICKTIYGFIIGQIIYSLSSPFGRVAIVMLKNNLMEKDKEKDFVKWQSYGKLGYAMITLIISLFAGILFNIFAYLPTILSLVCALIGLLFSIIYNDSSPNQMVKETKSVPIKSIMKNKIMILIMLMNFFAVGSYVFMQGKATLLIQNVCQNDGIELAKITIIVSGLVFGSRLIRVISNWIYPKIYNKVKKRSNILITIGILILTSNICFAIGGNIDSSYIIKLLIISIGFYIILFVRDVYSVSEDKIIATQLNENEQKQAYVLANIYGKIGKFILNAFALVVLGFMPLNIVYIFILIFSISQMFVCIPLSKYLK